MCDKDLGCQLRMPYWGFRIGGASVPGLGGELGHYGDNRGRGRLSAGAEGALTVKVPRSDDPQTGAFEGVGFSVGYTGEKRLSFVAQQQSYDSFVHSPYVEAELWTLDAKISVFAQLGYSLELSAGGQQIHGGRLALGARYRPVTAPMQDQSVNPYVGAQLLLGGERGRLDSGEKAGGLSIGAMLSVGVEFGPFKLR